MIDQVSSVGTPGVLQKSLSDIAKTPVVRTEREQGPERQAAPRADSVQLSPSAQARVLRREGQSIEQIAMKLGLAIPTVDAFFKE